MAFNSIFVVALREASVHCSSLEDVFECDVFVGCVSVLWVAGAVCCGR